MSDGEYDDGDRDVDKGNEGAVAANGGIPSLGEIFDCLTSSRRRITLYYLQENEIVDVDELVTQIAMKEAKIPSDEVSADRRDRIETQLVHTHLPKLADVQCIEYDRRSATVRYTQPPSLLDKALRLLSQLEEEHRE